jgi:subtilase family serine protease
MIRKVCLVPFLVATVALALNLASAATSRPRALITQAIDETSRVTLEGNTRPEANLKNDRGLVANDFMLDHMLLQLRRSPEQDAAAEQFVQELQVPSSPNYHKWLTAAQYGARFGVAQEDLDKIKNWLEGYGFKVNVVYDSHMVIEFSGTAGQVRQAFQTEIHRFDVKGVSHIANLSNPKIPAALAPAVEGVVSMHDFKPHAMHKMKSQFTFTNANGTFQALVPGDLAIIYGLNPLFSAGLTGTGQTVVIVEDTNFKAADWTTFRNKFGLSVTKYTGAKLTMVHPPSKGTNNCVNPKINGDDGEAALDAEWASAAAPNATIELISCADTNTNFGGLIAIQNLLNAAAKPPSIISMSYGECEAFTGAAMNAMFNTTFQQAVALGVSVFVSSGDQAASTCDRGAAGAIHGIAVTGWGETQYNVAVGGTDYSDTFAGTNSTYWRSTNTPTFVSAKSYIPEIPWNDSCAGTVAATFVTGSPVTYGSGGFCNTTIGEEFLDTTGGGGGPSKCATGAPSISGVVSGTCKGYPKPSYQAGVFGVPKDGLRDIPDVSLFASNGFWGHYFVFCDSDTANGGAPCTGTPDNWSGAGGTSFSSPILAGIQALINQKTGVRAGNPNVVFYALAKKQYGTTGSPTCNSSLGNTVGASCVFHDVTQGDIDVNCTGSHNCYRPSGVNGVLSTANGSYAPAYATTPGWDFATGLGTINANNLVKQWTTVAP